MDTDGEKFKEFALEQAKASMGGEEQLLGSMDGLNIEDAQYVLLLIKRHST